MWADGQTPQPHCALEGNSESGLLGSSELPQGDYGVVACSGKLTINVNLFGLSLFPLFSFLLFVLPGLTFRINYMHQSVVSRSAFGEASK